MRRYTRIPPLDDQKGRGKRGSRANTENTSHDAQEKHTQEQREDRGKGEASVAVDRHAEE